VLASALSGRDLMPGSYWIREQEEVMEVIRKDIDSLETN
jgi:hypothetical protein